MAPTLFGLYLAAVLQEATKDLPLGISIRFRSGQLFKLSRLTAAGKVSLAMISELLYADDCALVAHSEEDLQVMTRRFGSAFSNFGLTISIKKTEVMHQLAPGAPSQQPSITVNSEELKVVDSFVYLGSTLTRNGQLDKQITTRIAKASATFGRLNTRVWRQHGISIQTKFKVYRAAVVSTLLYGSESWTYYKRHVQQLEAFHQRKLRCLFNIKWEQRIPDTEILHRAKMSGIEAILVQNQLRWSGHVCRMEDSRIPKQLLYGEFCDGRRSVGGQRKRYKDVLLHNLLAAGINDSTWETIGQDRES